MKNKKNNSGFYGEKVPDGWGYGAMSNIIREITAGVSVNGEEREMKSDEYGVLKVSAVSYGFFDQKEYKVINKNEVSRAKVNPEIGSIIMSWPTTPRWTTASTG